MRHSYIDQHSNIDSFIHRLNPKIKIVVFIGFILFIALTGPSSFLAFSLYGAVLAVLIFLSKIPLGFILKRSLVVVPFVLFVAVFIPFFKKGQVVAAYSFGTFNFSVTFEGLMIFCNILIKAYLSILSMILLVTSTKFSQLLRALESLRCPSVFIMILSFMYRYIFLIQDELMQMNQAKQSRSTGKLGYFNIKSLANMLGVLFIRSYERAEAVYSAMCCRRFNGRVLSLDNLQLKTKDYLFLSTMTGLLVTIRIVGG